MVIYEGKSDIKQVAITFDDSPNPKYTPEILKVLKDKGVKSTFFSIGKNAEKYPNVVRQIVEDGHDVGNHTYTHLNLCQLLCYGGKKALEEEISKASMAISKVTGEEPVFFRPPGLIWGAGIEEVAGPLCNKVIVSDIGSGDWSWNWGYRNEDKINAKMTEILNDVKNNAKPGSIIALHDGSEYGLPEYGAIANWEERAIPTFRALPFIIDHLKDSGFSIVKLSEMSLVEEPLRV